ncbi:hypothetical protein [Holdemania sp. 1001302B_160321_E10]|uniref:hypothetical protein n=1 Tax=Holdemania sp. 1001302B_160321_E10 TaxID=2787120 RepID=UPI001899F911|nr:hypothetical protein [Holdemania sp. 1001302B_160321_E10]
MLITNEAARAYAVVAASMIPQQLWQDRVWCMIALYNQMVELMDIYTEMEIMDKLRNLIGQEDR